MKKQRHHCSDKGLHSQTMVFPVVMYGCGSWLSAKELMFLNCGAGEDTWKYLDCKENKPVNPKGNQPRIFIRKTDAEAEASVSSHLMWRANSLEKTLLLGKIEGRRKRLRCVRWDGWIAPLTQSHEFERIPGDREGQGKPDALMFMGSQRVRHNNKLTQVFIKIIKVHILKICSFCAKHWVQLSGILPACFQKSK